MGESAADRSYLKLGWSCGCRRFESPAHFHQLSKLSWPYLSKVIVMVISSHIYLKLWRTANAKVGHITKHVSVKCRFKFSLFLLFDWLRWQGDLNHGHTKHIFFSIIIQYPLWRVSCIKSFSMVGGPIIVLSFVLLCVLQP